MARAARVALLGEIGHRESRVSLGGTGAGLLRLAHGLRELDREVDLVTADARRLSAYGDALPPGTGTPNVGAGGRLSQTLRLAAYLLRRRPAILVARDSRAIDVALAATALVPVPPALVCALHNQANVRPDEDPRAEARKRRRFRRMARRADAVLAVSPGLLEAARARLGARQDRGVVIPNPAYREAASRAALARPIPRPHPDEPHLVFVGRLSPQKDLETLLRAFAQLVAGGRPARLSLVGEGPQREALRRHAAALGVAERVTFTGFVAEPMRYMADADAFVLASVQEAFGYVLVEALGVGLPVVSTDCPWGPRYILEDGRWGRLVPVGDAGALAEAVRATLAAPPAREALIERARAFDSRAIARRYAELFDALTASGRSTDR